MRKIYILFALMTGFLVSEGQKLKSVEYFFDSDPGIGNGIPISFMQADTLNQTFSVSVSTLNQGFHNLCTRVKDSLGIWSNTQSKIFYKMPILSSIPNSPKIKRIEYFVDVDPGVGHANPINFTNSGDTVAQTFAISVSSLSEGFHKLCVRVQDSLGFWSLAHYKIFYKIPVLNTITNTSKIKRIEYFVDVDPGVGHANPINFTNSGDTVSQIFSISVSSLSEGFHKLCVRVQDSLGFWSLAHYKIFYKIPVLNTITNTPKIKRIEYFIDADPGIGNGLKINFSTSGDSTSQIFSISVASLSKGFHKLTVRAQDSLGFWSLTQSKIFYIMGPVSYFPSYKIVEAEYYYDNDPGVGNGIPLTINFSDTINQVFSTSMSGLDSGYHFISVRIMDSLNVWSLVLTDTFRVLGCNTPVASFSGLQSLCIGDTINLTNNTTGTDQYISYQWDMDNNGINEFSSLGDTSYLFAAAGTYKIKLTATNSSIFSFGCVDTSYLTVVVHPLPQALVTVYGSGTICPGGSVSMGVSTGLGNNYQWLKDGIGLPNTNTAVYNAFTNGIYTAKVTSYYGCIDTSSATTISLYSMPSAAITPQGTTTFCYGDSVILNASTGTNLSYLWYKNGVPLLIDTLSQLIVSQPGSYKVQITSPDGCLDESSPQIIQVNPLPFVNLFALGNTSFCMGDSVVLQSNAGINYHYNWFKNGTLMPMDTTNILIVDTTGIYTVKITDGNQCQAMSSSASVLTYLIPTSTFISPSNICADDTATIQYTGTATPSAFYNWNFNGGMVISGSGQGPFEIKWNNSGNKNVSLTVSQMGCQSELSSNSTLVQSVVANIASNNTSVCQGDSVVLYANAGQNLVYNWYVGGLLIPIQENSNLVVYQTGNYQIKITDTLIGCSQMSNSLPVNINSTDFNLAFTANTTSFTQPPFNVSFTNQTPNMNSYNFLWEIGDGSTSTFYNPVHSYLYNGSYTVSMFAENSSTGCRDTLVKNSYINCTGGSPNPCSIVAAITPAGPVTLCSNDSVVLSGSAGTGYTYQWVYNNLLIAGATNINYTAHQAGVYRLIVSDNICSQTSPAFVLNHYPSIQPVIQATGIIQPCTFDSIKLSLLVNYSSYNWNTGSNLSSIYVNQTGYYQVSVIDNYGCHLTSSPYIVSNSFLNPPEICIVGVDSANHNRLIWERQSTNMIDSFYIYREGFIANQYNKIGVIPYNLTSLFVDTNSNPAIQAYRYKIAAVDTCGGVTLLSTYHKTIHLTINAGLNGSWNLIWDGYTGFNFNTYRIYRGINPNAMTLLTQLSSTATSYTDLNPPSGTVYYQIEVIKTTGCFPDTIQSKANTNYNTSRSNQANNGNIAPIYLDAAFTANLLSGIWPIQIQFTDGSTGSPNNWLWDFGDGNTATVQNPKHTYNNTGLYTVSLKICNGTICDTIEKLNYINVLPNGVVEISVDVVAKIYPNPNDGNFTLEISDKKEHQLNLFIYNALGQEVFSEHFKSAGRTNKTLNLGNLPKGVYFVNLSTADKTIFRTKILIQ